MYNDNQIKADYFRNADFLLLKIIPCFICVSGERCSDQDGIQICQSHQQELSGCCRPIQGSPSILYKYQYTHLECLTTDESLVKTMP